MVFDSCSGHNLSRVGVFVTIHIVALICAKCMLRNCTAPVCCVCCFTELGANWEHNS